ncbi:MAG: cytochrome c biogenesis heme-transporting ATPase CcmA [Variovorax sp.]|nr:cytochrome c biogenesis heme-transporting ATPase CcmA [Variovorax sp.]
MEAAAGPCLAARRLGLSRAGRPVFSGIDFALAPGGLLQVTGANGSGKSSLLRVLSGLLPPSAGELCWQARPVRGGDPAYLQSVAYVGHADGIDPDLSPFENLRFAMRVAGGAPGRAAIERAMADWGIARATSAPVRRLSQGQRRRVALVRLSLSPRRLWLLDEPLTSLDAAAAECFQARLDAHLHEGGMAVVATHQPLANRGRLLRLGG